MATYLVALATLDFMVCGWGWRRVLMGRERGRVREIEGLIGESGVVEGFGG